MLIAELVQAAILFSAMIGQFCFVTRYYPEPGSVSAKSSNPRQTNWFAVWREVNIVINAMGRSDALRFGVMLLLVLQMITLNLTGKNYQFLGVDKLYAIDKSGLIGLTPVAVLLLGGFLMRANCTRREIAWRKLQAENSLR
jgi:hypothetical protein